MSLAATTEKVKAAAEIADTLGATVKFVFNGGEGVVFLDGNNDNAVSNEDNDADCTIKIDHGDFNDLLSGELDSMSAFMGGKLQIEGDMGVAMKLTSLF